MHALADHPQIVSLALSLGLPGDRPVEEVKAFCVGKVKKLIGKRKFPDSIEEIERIVCEKLNVTIVEVWNEDDVDKVIECYARQHKDPIFATIRHELRDDTFATLIRRKNRPGESGTHFVAVVDCRGDKYHRRFFTRWHEIAHVLTMVDQWELPLHRSTSNKDALETMMDIIAAEIGFFDPLFVPQVISHFGDGPLTIPGVAKLREAYSDTASFQATLNACAQAFPQSVIVLEAELGYKKAELQDLEQGYLLPGERPIAKLRVTSSKGNQAAASLGMTIPLRMRVPAKSVITKALQFGPSLGPFHAIENLDMWSASNGRTLPSQRIWVEAKAIPNGVFAVITAL